MEGRKKGNKERQGKWEEERWRGRKEGRKEDRPLGC